MNNDLLLNDAGNPANKGIVETSNNAPPPENKHGRENNSDISISPEDEKMVANGQTTDSMSAEKNNEKRVISESRNSPSGIAGLDVVINSAGIQVYDSHTLGESSQREGNGDIDELMRFLNPKQEHRLATILDRIAANPVGLVLLRNVVNNNAVIVLDDTVNFDDRPSALKQRVNSASKVVGLQIELNAAFITDRGTSLARQIALIATQNKHADTINSAIVAKYGVGYTIEVGKIENPATGSYSEIAESNATFADGFAGFIAGGQAYLAAGDAKVNALSVLDYFTLSFGSGHSNFPQLSENDVSMLRIAGANAPRLQKPNQSASDIRWEIERYLNKNGLPKFSSADMDEMEKVQAALMNLASSSALFA